MGEFGAPAESTIQCAGTATPSQRVGGENRHHVQEKLDERTEWERRIEQRNIQKTERKGRCILFYSIDRQYIFLDK
jgi:hypothetical protein